MTAATMEPTRDRSVKSPKPDQQGIDPTTIRFTPQVLAHCKKVGFTLAQLHAALRAPRWVNTVRREPTPTHRHRTRLRYCGHGVAVIVQNKTVVAVIADDPTRFPAT